MLRHDTTETEELDADHPEIDQERPKIAPRGPRDAHGRATVGPDAGTAAEVLGGWISLMKGKSYCIH